MIEIAPVEGVGYRLRPVQPDDAEFVLKLRLANESRNKYINPVENDVEKQAHWISETTKKVDDAYFVVENKISGDSEGVIGIYNIAEGKAEWGRWVVAEGSLAATESVDLIFRFAFEKLLLDEVYSRTIVDNTNVVSFHDSLPQRRRCILPNHVQIKGEVYDVVEHYLTRDEYLNNIQIKFGKRISSLYARSLRTLFGQFTFHHLGLATEDIEKEKQALHMIGYTEESPTFVDPLQGITGQFLVAANQPRIELLAPLPESSTLSPWIKRGVKIYHNAYVVKNFEAALETFKRLRAVMISPPQPSVYFGKRIAFLALPNRFLFELIEAD